MTAEDVSLLKLGFHFIGSAFSNKHEFQIEKMKKTQTIDFSYKIKIP